MSRCLFSLWGTTSPATNGRQLAAGLRERHADAGPDRIEVTSAATGALVGSTVTPQIARLLAEHQADAEGFLARAVTKQMVADADLVLALTRQHRGRVVSLQGHPVRLHPARAAAAAVAGR